MVMNYKNSSVINKDNSEDIKKVVRLSWIPIFGPKLRLAFKRKSLTPFYIRLKLKNIMPKQTKLLHDSYQGVYEWKYTCNSTYFGENKKKILAWTIEHQQDGFKGKYHSRATCFNMSRIV